MSIRKILLIIHICFIYSLTALQAQQAIPATGGEATGTGGTVSFTVGQTSYLSLNNGLINEGVQQPYEFYSVGIDNAKEIGLAIQAFPNPANSYITLNTGDRDITDLFFHLFDISGRLILNQKIENIETTIPMESLSAGTYLLKVKNQKSDIKTFKIIKIK